MKLRRLSAFTLAAAATLGFAPHALAQGTPPPPASDTLDGQGIPQNGVFNGYTPDPSDQGNPLAIRLRDTTEWPIARNISPERRRKIVALVVTLQPPADVVITLYKGELTDIAKGRLKKDIDTLPPDMKKKIDDTQEGDEVIITAARIFEGQVYKKTDSALSIHPRNIKAGGGANGQAVYDMSADLTVGVREIVSFTNKTDAQRKEAEALNGGTKGPKIVDPIERMGLKPLDTVRVGLLVTGRVEEITPDLLTVKEWKLDGTWGDLKQFPRTPPGSLPPIEIVPLKHKRSYPITTANGPSEVILEEERVHQGSATPPLRLKGSIWHDQKDYVLAGAIITFQGGAKDGNWNQSPLREDHQVEPVFCGDRVVEERLLGIDAEDGEVKLDFNPAKHMIPATSPDAKTYALRALATKTDPAQLACVFSFVSRTNDPDFAIMLAYDFGQLPAVADNDRARASLLDALQGFGDVATQAIVEHIVVPDGVYRIPEPQAQGTIAWRNMSDSAGNLKKRELDLLDKLPGSAKGDRGKKLFDLYEERGTEFAEGVLKIFNSHANEAIDALLDIAISTSALSNPTSDAIKRAEHATDLIRRLGEKALSGLCDRIERQGRAGLTESRKLRQMVAPPNPTPITDVISIALERLIEWKRKEFRDALDRSLEEAKSLEQEKKWAEALEKVEDILKLDHDHQEAKKVLYQCLMKVAEQQYNQKKRGEASLNLRRIIEDKDKPRGTGAESLLGKILLEAAKEDADSICIRAGPLETYESLRTAKQGETLQIANVKTPIENWIPVKMGKDPSPTGWINQANILGTNAGAACQVSRESGDPVQVRKLLAQIADLAPELKPVADGIDGEFWLRDAEAKYAAGQYDGALVSYDSASKLCPDDPRLANRKWCVLRVNAILLSVFGGGVVVLAIVGGLLSLRRQKRIHITEFKYYGKDRARAERELDSSAAPGEAAGDAATAEPAPAPSGGEAPKA